MAKVHWLEDNGQLKCGRNFEIKGTLRGDHLILGDDPKRKRNRMYASTDHNHVNCEGCKRRATRNAKN